MGLPAIILAAGVSRRLGRPKQLVRVAGETLLARTVRVASEAGASSIFVVLGARRESIEAMVDLSGVQVIVNPAWEQGIASSICAGVEAVEATGAQAAMLLVCDQPGLSVPHVRSLMETFEEAGGRCIVSSVYAGVSGIPAIFPAGQFGRLRELKGDAGARSLMREAGSALRMVEFEGGEIDVDTSEDLERLG